MRHTGTGDSKPATVAHWNGRGTLESRSRRCDRRRRLRRTCAFAQMRSSAVQKSSGREALLSRTTRRVIGWPGRRTGFCSGPPASSSSSPGVAAGAATEREPRLTAAEFRLDPTVSSAPASRRTDACSVSAQTASLGEPPRSCAAIRMQVSRQGYVAATRALDQKGTPTMGIRLHDKTALVTGGTSNIGRTIVTAFAAEAHMLSSAAAAGCVAPRLSIRSARRAGAPTSSQRISMAGVVHPPTPDGDDGYPGA